MAKEELLKGLNEEEIAKVKACKNQEELLQLTKEEDIELTDEQLKAVSGGGCGSDGDVMECPECHSTKNVKKIQLASDRVKCYKCTSCNITWTIQ